VDAARLGGIEILHADDTLVVLDKPSGMLSHVHAMDRHSPNVQAVLERHLQRSVHLVHRLDRMTTGLMVVALTSDAARNLAFQFRNRTTTKRYVALVRGHTPDTDLISRPLEEQEGMLVDAQTSFTTIALGSVHETLGRYPEAWFSLLEVIAHTGRRHQIRRHLHGIDHPILGDNRHGDKTYNRWAESRFGERHLYLRAVALSFDHPLSGMRVTARVPLPALWLQVLNALGMEMLREFLDPASVSFGATA